MRQGHAGTALRRHDAIRVPAGDTAALSAGATGDTDLFAITLPPLPEAWAGGGDAPR